MPNSDFMNVITEDVKRYDGVWRMEKSSLPKRILLRKINPKRLHVNPADEFSMPDIGPNMSIVRGYEEDIINIPRTGKRLFEERIIIEKMAPDGYMILNGHHRWAAAMRMNVRRVRVQLVNVTHEADVHRVLSGVNNDKRATFDMDDIVFAAKGDAVEPMGFIRRRIYGHRMKLGVAALMRALKERGYDIWVFTKEYHSREYFNRFLKFHGVEATGIINGMNEQKLSKMLQNQNLAAAFRNKYYLSITVLKDSMLINNAVRRQSDRIDISGELIGATKSIMDQIDIIEKKYEESLATE